MKKHLLPVVILALVVVVTACKPQQTTPMNIPPIPADWTGRSMPAGVEADAGLKVYTSYCQSCHGSKGDGDGPIGASLDPEPTNLVTLASQVGDDFLFWRISTGVVGTSMPAWGNVLTEEEIWQLVAYIRTLR